MVMCAKHVSIIWDHLNNHFKGLLEVPQNGNLKEIHQPPISRKSLASALQAGVGAPSLRADFMDGSCACQIVPVMAAKVDGFQVES